MKCAIHCLNRLRLEDVTGCGKSALGEPDIEQVDCSDNEKS